MSVDPPITAVREVVTRALAEDLEPDGDLTSSLLPADATATARFVSRTDGVVAGGLCVNETLFQVDEGLEIEWLLYDGDPIGPNSVIAEVSGSLASILTAERTALNFLGRLSGVATLTSRYVHAAGGGAQIWDTRKTTPGLRILEKYAVRAGGGTNKRMGLYDVAMIKDNHKLAAGGITAAYRLVRERCPGVPVQVEVTTVDQAREAVAAGATFLLCDNMSPELLRAVVAAVDGKAELEATGGLTLAVAREYALTGVDYLSVGALTHSSPILDIALDLHPRR